MNPKRELTFHARNDVDDALIRYAVIVARYGDSWLFSRHKKRASWEIPGGHREPGETPMQTAKRELYEETGAITAEITEVGVYKLTDYGLLCFGDVSELGSIPADSEIAEVKTFQSLPDELTYGQIHEQLFHWVQQWLSEGY